MKRAHLGMLLLTVTATSVAYWASSSMECLKKYICVGDRPYSTGRRTVSFSAAGQSPWWPLPERGKYRVTACGFCYSAQCEFVEPARFGPRDESSRSLDCDGDPMGLVVNANEQGNTVGLTLPKVPKQVHLRVEREGVAAFDGVVDNTTIMVPLVF